MVSEMQMPQAGEKAFGSVVPDSWCSFQRQSHLRWILKAWVFAHGSNFRFCIFEEKRVIPAVRKPDRWWRCSAFNKSVLVWDCCLQVPLFWNFSVSPFLQVFFRKKTDRVKDNLDQMLRVCCGHHVLLSSCERTQGVIFPVSVIALK